MEIEELDYDMKIIFDKEIMDIENKTNTLYTDYQNGVPFIKSPNAEMLIELYHTISTNLILQKHFIDRLSQLIETNPETHIPTIFYNKLYSTLSKISFYTLIKIGFTDEALSALEKRKINSYGIIFLIEVLFSDNKEYFNARQLDRLMNFFLSIKSDFSFTPLKEKFQKQITEKKFNFLKIKIQQTNVEINNDKKALIEKINLLQFSDDYSKFLKEINTISKENQSDIINSGMIGNFRAFIEGIIKEIVKRIVEKTGDPIKKDEKRSEMGNIRVYLKEKLGISDADNEFITSFINILHKEGGHAFTSSKEYYRLTINIGIEIVLLLVTKYETNFERK